MRKEEKQANIRTLDTLRRRLDTQEKFWKGGLDYYDAAASEKSFMDWVREHGLTSEKLASAE